MAVQRLSDTLYNLLDQNTGENITYNKVTLFRDGSAMDDSKADGLIYIKSGTEYFKINYPDAIPLKMFGVVGDGVTDDTAALNTAFASGVPFLKGERDATYLVSYTGNKTLYVAYRYCVLIKSNTKVDFAGGTMKLADDQNACLLMNDGFGADTDENITILNLKVDGNRANQTEPATGDMSCVNMYGITNLNFQHFEGFEARQTVARFLKITNFIIDDLRGIGSDGGIFNFGTAADGQELKRGHFGTIYAEGGHQDYPIGSVQGEAAVFTCIDTTLDSIIAYNCAGPIKIQDSSYNASFANISYTGGATHQGENTGVKVEGNLAGLTPKKISIGNISVRDAWGYGLYLVDNEDVSIGSYTGTNNNKVTTLDDVALQQVKNLKITNCNIDTPNGIGMIVNNTVGLYSIDNLTIRNATGRALSVVTGTAAIGNLKVTDDRGTPLTTYAVFVSGAGAKGRIDNIYCNLAPTTTVPRLYVTEGSEFEFGVTQLGDTSKTSGYATLSNAGTTTVVANPNFFKIALLDGNYLQPIIEVIPINGTAKNLGSMMVTFPDFNVGPNGFTINHGTAGATDKVFWRLKGWKNVPVYDATGITAGGIPDASFTVAGKVNLTTQQFAGIKDFQGSYIIVNELRMNSGASYTKFSYNSNDGGPYFGYNINNAAGVFKHAATGGTAGVSTGSDAIRLFTDTSATTGTNLPISKLCIPVATGNVLIGTETDDATNKLQVSGAIKATQFKLSALNTAPASATATGTTGEIRIDAGFIYVCIATNTWVRSALATW